MTKSKQSFYKFFILLLLLGFFIFSVVSQFIRNKKRDPYLESIRDSLISVHPDIKNIDIKDGNGSFTVNKKRVYMCVKKNKQYYSANTLRYVLLHEFAHVITKIDSSDPNGDPHTPEFHSNFNQLLERAQSLGLYDPKEALPKNYCDLDV